MNKFPVKKMCRVLNLPTGTFYNYHLRRVKITQNQIRDEYLKGEILKIFNEACQRFGAPKITAKLSTLGIKTIKSKVSNFKREKINHHGYEYFEELQESIKEYMNYYNDYRPHSGQKNKTPNLVENDHISFNL